MMPPTWILLIVEGLSIATLDKNLRTAASNAGVELLPG